MFSWCAPLFLHTDTHWTLNSTINCDIAYLKYLDVEILKIDGIFIQDLFNNYANQVFVKAMVSIAQGFGKLLVAECVENAETLKLLQALDVKLVQGYYLDYPISQHEALKKYTIEIGDDELTK